MTSAMTSPMTSAMTSPEDLSHLTMPVSIAARCNYQLRQVIAHTSNTVPGARTVLRLAQKVLTHLNNIDNAFQQTRLFSGRISVGSEPSRSALSFESGFGYTSEFRELEVAEYYRQQLIQGDWDKQKTESGDLYAAILPLLSKLLSEGMARDVLDFGVSYGHVDSQIAEWFPNVRFTGIDRSIMTKVFNEQYFQLPNLAFVAGDVFEHIDSHPWVDAVLFHMRTLVCLPQSFVEDLYAKCSRAGFKYIVGAEQCGLSWQTGKPYEFSFDEQSSVVFRNCMFIHNYPGILKQAGYRLKEARLLKTRHPDPNYRLLLFSAERES